MIEDSKARGVWSGYISREYGADMLDEILSSDRYLKIKTIDPLNKNPKRTGSLWGIVKKGFEKSIFN